MRVAVMTAGALLSLTLSRSAADAQDWRESAAHLGTTARVLIVGTRPEDEDNALIAWLSLGRHIETAYLSLTRGESGANLGGLERDSPLGMLRTAELLAERGRDGAHQYFTRAYDFGPTPVDSIVDAAWPHDSLLVDVVSVVRAFRPQVVIVLANDHDGRDATRRLTARLVGEAFTVAADTVRLPSRATSRLPAWSVARLLTMVATDSGARIESVDVGEFDRAAGSSYAELGAEIRRLQRSQPIPPAPSLGPHLRLLRLGSARVAGTTTLFGAIDTTLDRFRGALSSEASARLDTLRFELDAIKRLSADGAADSVAVRLARVVVRTGDVRLALTCRDVSRVPACPGAMGDLAVALETIHQRASRALLGAAGLVVDGRVARPLVAAGDSVQVTATVYDGGSAPVTLRRLAAVIANRLFVVLRDTSVVIQPGVARSWSTTARVLAPTYAWWQTGGLQRGTRIYVLGAGPSDPVVPQLIGGEDRISTSGLEATVSVGGVDVPLIAGPLTARAGTSLRSDMRHPLTGVPEISVLLERSTEYERASRPIDRVFRVYVSSARSVPDSLAVTLRLPSGLVADSATRTIVLPAFGARNLFFRLRGRLAAGAADISASAHSLAAAPRGTSEIAQITPAREFTLGVVMHEYPHIPALKFVRFASDRLQAVDLRVPPRLAVAYVSQSDALRTPFAQLQVNMGTIRPELLPLVDLSRFTSVLVDVDALTGDAMQAAIPSLQRFLRGGGTIIVLAAGDDARRSGLLPFPIAFGDQPGRLRDPAGPVRLTDAQAPLLTSPNRITVRDFDDWVSSRASSVPITFDPRYGTLLSAGDRGENPTTATILAARVGRGVIIYTALSLGEQLQAAVPGAARLIVNLLSAGMAAGAH